MFLKNYESRDLTTLKVTIFMNRRIHLFYNNVQLTLKNIILSILSFFSLSPLSVYFSPSIFIFASLSL